MKASHLLALAAAVVLVGCDNITGLDNRDPPGSTLSGRVVYQGEPVGVRSSAVELELWEPAYFEKYGELEKIPVNVRQDGTFEALVYDGDYELNLLTNNGPWVNDATVHTVQVRGSAEIEIPVTPYYTIIDPSVTRGAPTADAPGGTVTATFRVAQVNTSRDLQFVGLYVGTTSIVDRINSVNISNSQRELARADIQDQLDANQTITITVKLPDDIYETDSPWIREYVFVRVGVKTNGVTELLYSPVQQLGI